MWHGNILDVGVEIPHIAAPSQDDLRDLVLWGEGKREETVSRGFIPAGVERLQHLAQAPTLR